MNEFGGRAGGLSQCLRSIFQLDFQEVAANPSALPGVVLSVSSYEDSLNLHPHLHPHFLLIVSANYGKFSRLLAAKNSAIFPPHPMLFCSRRVKARHHQNSTAGRMFPNVASASRI
jgi:hypothetical protein